MSTPIPIITGDPVHQAASFTRFALPFGYRPALYPAQRPKGGKPPGLAYFHEQTDPADRYRRQYLTFETAAVLYERTSWLELRRADSGAPVRHRFALRRGDDRLPVELAPPRLVLFEGKAAFQDGGEAREGHGPARGEDDPLLTGFLLLDLSFPESATYDDLLFANEIFRYWLKPFHDHGERSPYVDALQEAPRSLRDLLQAGPGSGPPSPDLYADRWAFLLEAPCEIDGRLWQLVNDSDREAAETWATTGRAPGGWVVYSDARAFVWTCALLGQGAAAFTAAGGEPGAEPERCAGWIGLLNVDRSATAVPSSFEIEWAHERTYRRWQHLGTLYGFTSHSGAMVGPPCLEPPLWRHFREPYFDHILLLLYLRVGLFRFSRRLAEASGAARDRARDHRDEDFEEELRRIRTRFTLFTNLYQYPLLSNQQQALEMYALAREVLDLPVLFAELHEQIKTSHEFLDMVADHQETLAARRLNVVAACGLALALATGFLGMNVLVGRLGTGTGWEWLLLGVSVAVALLLLVGVGRRWRRFEHLLFGREDKPKRRNAL